MWNWSFLHFVDQQNKTGKINFIDNGYNGKRDAILNSLTMFIEWYLEQTQQKANLVFIWQSLFGAKLEVGVLKMYINAGESPFQFSKVSVMHTISKQTFTLYKRIKTLITNQSSYKSHLCVQTLCDALWIRIWNDTVVKLLPPD